MTMPDLTGYSGYNVVSNISDALANAEIITKEKTGGTFSLNYNITANCNVNITTYDLYGESTTISLAEGETTTYTDGLITGATTSFTQSPVAGSWVYSTSTVTATQINPHVNDTLLGQMPNNPTALSLSSAGILSKSGNTYTVLCNKLTISKKTNTTSTYATYNQNDTFSTSDASSWTQTPDSLAYPNWTSTTSSPVAGKNVYDVSTVSIIYVFGSGDPIS